MGGAAVPTIMIVGDDENFSYLMQRYMHESGYRALVCHLSPDLTLQAQHEQPAVILLEVSSFEASGRGVVRQLKENHLTQHIPIVVCSWLEEDLAIATEGVTRYLHKPVMYRDVLAALADAGVSIVKG
jgi:CheY-like chemotaxis protein